MRRLGWIAPLVVLALGCQKWGIGEQEEPSGDRFGGNYGQEGTNGYPEGTDGYQGGTNGQIGEMAPAPVRKLGDVAQDIRTAQDFSSNDLVRSLRQLQDALGSLPDAGTELRDAGQRIGAYADRIEASGSQAQMHGRWAKRAFNEALDALQGYGNQRDVQGLDTQLQGIRGLVDALGDDQPIANQKDNFANIYSQMADTLAFVAQHGAPTEPGTR